MKFLSSPRKSAFALLAVLGATSVSGLGLRPAHADDSDAWKKGAIAAGAVGLYGVLTGKGKVATIGGIAAAGAYAKYRSDKRDEQQDDDRFRNRRGGRYDNNRYGGFGNGNFGNGNFGNGGFGNGNFDYGNSGYGGYGYGNGGYNNSGYGGYGYGNNRNDEDCDDDDRRGNRRDNRGFGRRR